MNGHVYSPGPSGFCGVCQEQAMACTGSLPAPRSDTRPRLALAVPQSVNGDSGDTRPPGRQVFVTLASQIKPRPVHWLWPDRIPAGALTLLAGREGIGKASSASTSPRSSPAAPCLATGTGGAPG
jgi:AAA domain